VKKKCDDFTHLSMSFGEAINTGQELGHWSDWIGWDFFKVALRANYFLQIDSWENYFWKWTRSRREGGERRGLWLGATGSSAEPLPRQPRAGASCLRGRILGTPPFSAKPLDLVSPPLALRSPATGRTGTPCAPPSRACRQEHKNFRVYL
jgi:hypothetical protein